MSNILRQVVKTRNFYRITPVNCRRFASKTNLEENVEVEKKEERELDLKTFRLASRVKTKQPALPPCIKHMFVGDVHLQYFPFLEVIEKEYLDRFFNDRKAKVDEFWQNTEFKEKCLDGLKTLGNVGYNVPQIFNGHGMDLTEVTLNSEIEVENFKANSILSPHRIVAQVINDHGTEAQKNKYLPGMANGDIIATIAVFERELPQDVPFFTTANPGKSGFLLDGEKDFVINGNQANLFLVLASSKIHSKDLKKGVSAVLVDGNDPGLLRGPILKTIGMNDMEQCSVTFTNIQLRNEHVIGGVDDIQDVGMKLIQLGRLQSSVMAQQLSKQILNHLTRFCIETKTMGTYVK